MEPELSSPAERARTALAEEISTLLHEPDEVALLNLLENPNLTEEHVCILLERAEVSARILEAVATRPQWKQSEPVRLRLVRHRHTPRRIALTLLRQLFLFDLTHIIESPAVLPEIRRAAENSLLQRLPHLSLGEKLSLARRGSARIAGTLLAEGHPQGMRVAIDNPQLTEAQILRVLALREVPERVVAAVASHEKWSRRRDVRLALIRQPKTPLSRVLQFLPELTTEDLTELVSAELSENVRVYISLEAARRSSKSKDKSKKESSDESAEKT